MRYIETREELIDVARGGKGFIYNDFGGSDPKMCPVHAIHCTWIERMLAVKPGRLSVKKIWAEKLDSLLSWLHDNGKVFSLCSFCNPETAAPQQPTSRIRPDRVVCAGASSTQWHVVGPSGDHPAVEVWSSVRLPFEPTGELLRLRGAIRDALARLLPVDSCLCYGLYVSPETGHCDTENVLFYNVGTSYFRHLARQGICFERSFHSVPPPAEPLEFEPRHYHRYECVPPDSAWRHWSSSALIATCEATLRAGRLSAERVWWAARNGRLEVTDTSQKELGHFGIRVRISNANSRPADAIKTIFDGVIAAFHAHNGNRLQECSARLSRLLGEDQHAVAQLLMDERYACLGIRRLLWPWRNSVQWNPADDRCVAGMLVVNPDRSKAESRLSVELLSVSELSSGSL